MTVKRKKKGTRQRLLESAAIIFSEKGYANTSVAEICDHAEANIASVNYHFRSKEALYLAVLKFTGEQAEALYPFKLDFRDRPEKRFYDFVLALLRRILSEETAGNFYGLVAKEMVEPSGAGGTLVAGEILRHQGLVKALIRDVCGRELNEDLLFRLLFSVMSQCLFFSYNEKGRRYHLQKNPLQFVDAESFARHITDFSLAGINFCCRE
ncbi:MAG: CerR family C-terminal domain-containing protein [Deltaproteobacteria bacterium]|nr:CerR family C-terminal domain-containing protein [Deltaproteobacteria bacterium]